MLVLTRRNGEAVVLSDGVTVTVVEVRGDRVRLGFDGPREIEIDRKEVHESKMREGRRKDKRGEAFDSFAID